MGDGAPVSLVDEPSPVTAAPAPPVDVVRRRRRSLPKVTALVVVLIAELITFSILAPEFLTRNNFLNVLTAISVTGIVAMPGTLLIVAGQFDLSVASITALTGVAMATAAESHSLAVGIIVAFAVGIAAGLANGFLVTVVGVNALITTLGMLSVLSGLARVIADGLSVPVAGFSTLGTARPLGIPLPVIVLLAVVPDVLVPRTVHHLRPLGVRHRVEPQGGPVGRHPHQADRRRPVRAVRSGVRARRPHPHVDARLRRHRSPRPAMELSVVTAIVLGGTTLSGGEGTVFGTLVGLMIVGFLNNGLIIQGVDPFWQPVAQGGLLIGAVSFDRLRLRVSRARGE